MPTYTVVVTWRNHGKFWGSIDVDAESPEEALAEYQRLSDEDEVEWDDSEDKITSTFDEEIAVYPGNERLHVIKED